MSLLRTAGLVVCILVAVALLSLLTLEPVSLSAADLGALRFITVAPVQSLGAEHSNSEKLQTSKGGWEQEAQREEGEIRRRRRGGWHDAEAREWRSVVNQVSQALAWGTTDFWFRYPARPSAPADRRLHLYNGLPRGSEPNTIILYIGGAWAGLAANQPKLHRWRRWWTGNNVGVAWAMRFAWRCRPPCPVVGLNLPTDRVVSFNAGQLDDSRLIQHIMLQLGGQDDEPKSRRVVVVGACLGGLRVANWLGWLRASRRPVPSCLAGVVLESPLPALDHYGKLASENPYVQTLVYGLAAAVAPNYQLVSPAYQQQSLSEVGSRLVPASIPVLVATIAGDPISNDETLKPLLDQLPHASRLVATERRVTPGGKRLKHGRMVLVPAYHDAIRSLVQTVSS